MTMNRRVSLCVVVLFIALSYPLSARAQCEPPGVAAVAAATGSGTIVGTGIVPVTAVVTTAVNVGPPYVAFSAPVSARMGVFSEKLKNRMQDFWSEWNEAWRSMAGQMVAVSLTQQVQEAMDVDAANMNETKLALDKAELEARNDFDPDAAACTAGSVATYARAGGQRSRAISSALSKDVNDLGNNKKGTIAASGPAAVQNARWQTYVANFCDPSQNAGKPGCKQPGATMNADIQPTQMLFTRDTIDMTKKQDQTALRELAFNLTSYKVPPPINPESLKQPEGREQRMSNREYLTQMDAVNALVSGLIAERAPGEKSTEVQALRIASGVTACTGGDASPINCASETPSAREIRQARIEELRNPKYYIDLGGNQQALQKEVLLRALNVSMTYAMLEKMEKIANIYAIQTGNLLDSVDRSRGGGNQYAPIQGGE